ncbi:hypothetical protein PI95_034160 [Hassallia byssoidea VB512170]|uniref:Uncharacterized protein n=1 Tax=Hassallia byssoidea VB512170 TaxID=1304833 RepID=A0A846HPV9_9CYAN|nr:hypothetical protein [Hassalia byssoidea]NEU77381.1 hypothetical protein [Hassalia byssoidea VB512170]
MSENFEIIFPSIDIFLYDLKDGLGQEKTTIDQNCRNFCKKIYGDLDETKFEEKYKQFHNYQDTEVEVIELLDTRNRNFPSPLDGYYYPVQIGDTYALQINYSGKLDANSKYNDKPQGIKDEPFLKLKQEITQRISGQTGTIGQTWLFWGKVKSYNTDQEIEKVAQKCYTQIVSNYDWERDLIGKGKLEEGMIFELWYSPQNLGGNGKEFWEKFRQENGHVFIWLFPDSVSPDEMIKRVRSTYYQFMRLWLYRHKVVWSYYQSRYQKTLLKKKYVEIQPAIKQTKELPRLLQSNNLKLSKLQETLTSNLINLSDYTIALNSLENHIRTIKLNLDNYESRLNDIQNKYVRSDLEFLKTFSESENCTKKYQRQVEADHANLSPGLTLLQNLNSTIQGIIDLEQTKSDRKLDNTIAIAGIGLAIGGITATAISAQKDPPLTYNISFLTEPVFVWSMVLSAPFLIALLFRLFRSR